MRSVTAIATADFLERIRRRSFLVITALLLWACFAAVPPASEDYSLVTFGNIRGNYDGAWLGLMFGLVCVTLLPLVAFYLVRGAINRDRTTRVGPILAATQLTRWAYLFGKLLSNIALLATILAVIFVAGTILLWFRRTTPGFDLLQFAAPLWTMALPVLVIVAGVAVLFETVRWLRGGFGNVVYFFLWTFCLGLAFSHYVGPSAAPVRIADPFGASRVIASAKQYIAREVPGYRGDVDVVVGFGFGSDSGKSLRVLPWPDYPWSGRDIAPRLVWLIAGVLLVLPAGLFFDRFDPARGRMPRVTRRKTRAPPFAPMTDLAVSVKDLPAMKLHKTNPMRLVTTELKLLLSGQPLWWWAVMAGLFIASLVTPLEVARRWILPLLWVVPVLVFSPLGARDRLAGVTPLLASSMLYGWRLIFGAWIAGFSFALVLALGVIVRTIVAGEPTVSVALLVGALFVPALALALGNLTKSSRLFEVVYLGLWYVAVRGVSQIDFMVRTPASVAWYQTALFLGAVVILLSVAIMARRIYR